MTFDHFSFDRRLVTGIKYCGYVTPTPIQTQAIPEVLQGKDVMGLAQTGTGKTAAFALPILQRLIDNGAHKQGPIRTLVLAPTRELASQINETFFSLGKETGIRSAVAFGGVGMNPQIKAASKATVLVACPGRLVNLLKQRDVRLDQVETLVLDEADRMLDMGFMPDIKRVLSYLPKKRQNLLFSATMPNDIRALAEKILHNPKTVQVANTAPVASINQEFYPVHQHLKAGLLEAILDKTQYKSVLIFTRTKHKAKNLARKLCTRGHEATFLQGNMSQNQRVRALNGFKDGTFKIMVATDIAARGIDCAQISHVINFDAPDTAETYTHRIGRTGRAGRSGKAMSLMTNEDKILMRDIQRIVSDRIDHCELDGFDYDKAFVPQPGGNNRRSQGPKQHFQGRGNGGNKNRGGGRKPGRGSRRSSRSQAR
ncbi:DEAD/DEAH box helicase [Pseudodesulfovibrio sp.]|nr:DEAD/DEAH box helicase [Pseudodesulfovibrio sp.]